MICNLCPRNCNALRSQNSAEGFCRMPETIYLARAALHMWEEPPISGLNGAGAIFFSGCNLQCVFCQNYTISAERFGKEVSDKRLIEICYELKNQGANNIDLVSPTHYAHKIIPVLEKLKQDKFDLPIVWNTSGYEKLQTLKALEGLVDIYMPDFKYFSPEKASKYSNAEDYPDVVKNAILEMYRQTGDFILSENGLMQRGVIIRHLLLPGNLKAAKDVMDWIAESFPPNGVLFSLMSQYLPMGKAESFPEINRSVRKTEAKNAIEYMQNLNLNGFTQDLLSANAKYVPDFDLFGI